MTRTNIENTQTRLTVYGPASMNRQIEEAIVALYDIDGNFSRLLQVLMPDIIDLAKEVKEQDKKFKQYQWKLTAQPKKGGDQK